MPSKKAQIPKTPVKPDDDVDPATIAKNNENKESARKLISTLKDKIPRVHSPIKREELSDIFCEIKCNCELEEASTTDRLDKLIAVTDAEILEPSKPEKYTKEDSTTTESDKASDLGMESRQRFILLHTGRTLQTVRGRPTTPRYHVTQWREHVC